MLSFIVLSGLALMPQLAKAISETGTVTRVRTCPDGAGGQKVVIDYDIGGGTIRTVFMGIDAAGHSPVTTLANSALLSGRSVTIEHGNGTSTQCGVTALDGNSTSHFIQLN
jgi:hypothetical protein